MIEHTGLTIASYSDVSVIRRRSLSVAASRLQILSSAFNITMHEACLSNDSCQTLTAQDGRPNGSSSARKIYKNYYRVYCRATVGLLQGYYRATKSMAIQHESATEVIA